MNRSDSCHYSAAHSCHRKPTLAITSVRTRTNNLLAGLSLLASFLAAPSSGAEPRAEPGVMLRAGVWGGGAGSYSVPAAFTRLKPAAWPADGWSRLIVRPDRIDIEPVLPPKQRPPDFLKSIAAQLENAQAASASQQSVAPAVDGDVLDPIYLRVPGASLQHGSVARYRFRNGTASLRPILDHRYELALAGKSLAFTVRNGRRGKNGSAYGDGAQYTIEYDGNTYAYSLGEFGWDSTITAIADLDGDGKPDFIISVGGNNAGYEAILLSSTAQPGPNAPTASLRSTGC